MRQSVQVISVLLLLMIVVTNCAKINKDLRLAAIKGHTSTVQALLDNGAEVNAKDNDGRTSLMLAAGQGHTATVQVLLDNGVEVNAKSNDDKTALMWARSRGYWKVVELLKKAGAK